MTLTRIPNEDLEGLWVKSSSNINLNTAPLRSSKISSLIPNKSTKMIHSSLTRILSYNSTVRMSLNGAVNGGFKSQINS